MVSFKAGSFRPRLLLHDPIKCFPKRVRLFFRASIGLAGGLVQKDCIGVPGSGLYGHAPLCIVSFVERNRFYREEQVMSDSLLFSLEGSIARIVFNRPDVFNALDGSLLRLLADRLMDVAIDPKVRAVILTGTGKAFCSGADLRMLISEPDKTESQLYVLAPVLHQSVIELRRMNKPAIAAINGVAAGAGLSLALACDFRVMAKSAVLKQAYTSWGLCMDGGSTYTLPRLIGLARTLEIAGMDAPITSEQALAWGLATKVTDDDRVLDEAMAMASALAERSLHAFGIVKQCLNDSFHTPLEMQLEREREAIALCGKHPDGQEGMTAFASKRKPVFRRE